MRMKLGGRQIRGNTTPPWLPDGARSPTRLIPGTNQEHLGCVYPKRTVVRGLLLGVRVTYCDRDIIPWGVIWDGDSAGTVAGGEVWYMTWLGSQCVWGGASAPIDRKHCPAEVSPAGVGLRAARHPSHRYGVLGGGVWDVGHISPSPLSGFHVPYHRDGDHQYAGQSLWYRPT